MKLNVPCLLDGVVVVAKTDTLFSDLALSCDICVVRLKDSNPTPIASLGITVDVALFAVVAVAGEMANIKVISKNINIRTSILVAGAKIIVLACL